MKNNQFNVPAKGGEVEAAFNLSKRKGYQPPRVGKPYATCNKHGVNNIVNPSCPQQRAVATPRPSKKG